MFRLPLMSSIFSCLILLSCHVEADRQDPNFPSLQMQQDTNYQPSLGVVIGILGMMFVITMVILFYAKLCYEPTMPTDRNRSGGQNRGGLSRRFSGIDKTVIESLPFFRFSSLKGSKEGLECAVCLSKFEDVEVLRMLPKCRHAFHIDCIDHWLERHSTCPLCRHRISSQDLKLVAYSNSFRFLSLSGTRDQDPNGLFVEREESRREGGIIGSSFKKIESVGTNDLHKHNHKIVVSDFVFNNRWSDLRSSDLAFLNAEMLNERSSGRFPPEIEMKKKLLLNNQVSTVSCGERRSVSEITAVSRYAGSDHVRIGITAPSSSSSGNENENEKEENRKRWLPIARRTIQWFATKDTSKLSQSTHTQTIDV